MKKIIIIFSIVSLCFGLLWFAIQQSFIIISFARVDTSLLHSQAEAKKVTLHFFKHDTWHQETVEMVHQNDQAATIQMLAACWVTMAQEERLIDKSVAVATVIINESGTQAFINFNQSPFDDKQSLHERYMLILGLLKTLHLYPVSVQSVRFLVQHQPLEDDRLSFQHAWPIQSAIE